MAMNENSFGRMYYEDKMWPYLEGALAQPRMGQSQEALQYMRKRHEGQFRKDGQPYEIHPMMMACYALSLSDPNINDDVIATILLHDVVEDTPALIDEIPFNQKVRDGVRYMTLTRFDGETKFEQKRRYMNELLESKEAIITKAIDRYFNLSTMGMFPEDKIRKNVVETDMLLLPVLKEAKHKWPGMKKLLHILRANVRNINDVYAALLKVKLTDPGFVNPPDAKDYSYLIMDA